MKLKYELEQNVNLVRFDNKQIEISFNENLDKNFVKDLSLKLFEWTGERWIITLSKTKGGLSVKDKEKNKKIENINNAKQSKLYKSFTELIILIFDFLSTLFDASSNALETDLRLPVS